MTVGELKYHLDSFQDDREVMLWEGIRREISSIKLESDNKVVLRWKDES